MEFRTKVDVPSLPFQIEPFERMLFVGSCFADRIGRRFQEEPFTVFVNPFGVMYNPASILHTVEQLVYQDSNVSSGSRCGVQKSVCAGGDFDTIVFTLGTNHLYIEKATGQIVDNCKKRPGYLFEERELSIDECVCYLKESIRLLRERNPKSKIILTVSPIRYAKYGFHGSQLSKAILLLAVDKLLKECDFADSAMSYFPAYEIVMDELRDYRFYQSDMIHPSEQVVDYIWEQLMTHAFSNDTKKVLDDWQPIKAALAHRPFNPESEEYKAFVNKTKVRMRDFQNKYGDIPQSSHFFASSLLFPK